MKKLASALIVTTVLLSGCTQRLADLTLASTKNIELNNSDFVIGRRVSGEDTKAIILFPIGMPSIEEAADNAIENDRCAVGLSDVTASMEFFALLVGYQKYQVEGDLIIDKTKTGCGNWIGQDNVHGDQGNEPSVIDFNLGHR